jgi:hypothetical protein
MLAHFGAFGAALVAARSPDIAALESSADAGMTGGGA